MVQANPVCPHCGAATSPDAHFCPACGQPIVRERACPHCGAQAPPTAQFCGECGQPMQAPLQPQVQAPPVRNPPRAAVIPPRAAVMPAQVTAMPPPVKPARARPRTPFLILGGCAGVIMLCLIGAVGTYFAVRSGAITQKQLLNLVGLGPGTITVMNFRDDPIQTMVTPIRSSQESQPAVEAHTLAAYEITSVQTADAGKYRVDIQVVKTGQAQGSCALNVRGGDQYRFVSLPNGILIMRDNSPSKDPKDLFPETSAFCQ
ncbi:MAG: zinc-ribbon domain-containing protein [Anaerolineae bacterium]